MITKAMPLLLNREGKHLELRNSADEAVLPATQLKSGEDARAAAKRALEEFFGFSAPEDAIKEGFQARVGNEVVAIYPVDAQKMEMDLLRPAESIATWAWRDVPPSMGKVVALGFPRNLGERRNAAEAAVGSEAVTQYHLLADALAARRADLPNTPAHERPAREAEVAQALEDLRLLGADLGIEPGADRLNAAETPCPNCESHNAKHLGNFRFKCEKCGEEFKDHEGERRARKEHQNASGGPLTARALIRQNDGTILAARQKDGRSLLPGGHIENGETPEGAVARELQEELGLDIKEAMTGESYDFHGEDGSSHRVFVVDGSRLDLSKLVPGDDVEDAEIVNSPFTDSHGQVHPQEGRENGGRFERPCPTCGGGAYIEDAAGNDVKCPKCKGTGVEAVSQMKNDAGGDVAEIERHVEGIKHEVGELEKQNAGNPKPGETCPKCKSGKIKKYGDDSTGCDSCGQSYDRAPRDNSERLNAVQKYVFRANPGSIGEENVTIEANSEVAAWNKLADEYATTVSEMKRDGIKLVSIRQNAGDRRNTIEKLGENKFRLVSHEGKNLGDFPSHAAAAKHEGEVEYFKEHKNDDERENAGAVCAGCKKPLGPGQAWDSYDTGKYWCKKCDGTKAANDPMVGKGGEGDRGMKTNGSEADAGAHNHMYPDRLNGAFPVLLCDGNETIATQETTDGWRCEACGDVIAGPPKPETVIDKP